MGVLQWFFDTSDFPARWFCGTGWNDDPWVGWLHVVSDLVTWASYILIPLVLGYFKLGRKDIQLPPVFFLFIAFIFSCGTVHLLEAVIFWWPVYRLSAVAKLITALVSVATVISLIRVAPAAMALPSIQRLNEQLQKRATQREALLTELKQSNGDLEAFAHVASHDLKSPLRGVAQLTSWIEEDLGDKIDDTVRPHFELLHGRIHRMESLLDDLLVYSSVGRQSHADEWIDLRELTEEVLGLIDRPDGFAIDQHWVNSPTIRGPRPLLKMILLNLITNAIKHHDRPTGHVLVSASEIDDTVTIRILDDGPGIEEAFRAKVFEPFATLRSRDDTEGTGLGLSLVRKMTNRLGGTIQIESTQQRGCCFVVTLPKTHSNPPTPTAP